MHPCKPSCRHSWKPSGKTRRRTSGLPTARLVWRLRTCARRRNPDARSFRMPAPPIVHFRLFRQALRQFVLYLYGRVPMQAGYSDGDMYVSSADMCCRWRKWRCDHQGSTQRIPETPCGLKVKGEQRGCKGGSRAAPARGKPSRHPTGEGPFEVVALKGCA